MKIDKETKASQFTQKDLDSCGVAGPNDTTCVTIDDINLFLRAHATKRQEEIMERANLSLQLAMKIFVLASAVGIAVAVLLTKYG